MQYYVNGGKCGICGDPWNGEREHEAGGKYAQGTIVKHYQVNQEIQVAVQITANHLGWMEFHLCPTNNSNIKATQDCLNKYPLRMCHSLHKGLYTSTTKDTNPNQIQSNPMCTHTAPNPNQFILR